MTGDASKGVKKQARKTTKQAKVLLSTKQKPPAPEPPTPTRGQPVRVLQEHNVYLPVREVNRKVKEITDAHQRTFGGKPTADVVFDLLRGDAAIQKRGVTYDEMFSEPPKSRYEHQIRQIARETTPKEPLNTDKLIQGMRGHTHAGRLDFFLEEHADQIEEALEGPDKKKMQEALKAANSYDKFVQTFSHDTMGDVAKNFVVGAK